MTTIKVRKYLGCMTLALPWLTYIMYKCYLCHLKSFIMLKAMFYFFSLEKSQSDQMIVVLNKNNTMYLIHFSVLNLKSVCFDIQLRDLQFFQFYDLFQYNISWLMLLSADDSNEKDHKIGRTKDRVSKGPSINYVVSKLAIFDPLPPLVFFIK